MAKSIHAYLWSGYPRYMSLTRFPAIIAIPLALALALAMHYVFPGSAKPVLQCMILTLFLFPFVWCLVLYVFVFPRRRKRSQMTRATMSDEQFIRAIEQYQISLLNQSDQSDLDDVSVQYIPQDQPLIPHDFILAARMALAEMYSIDAALIHADDDCFSLDALNGIAPSCMCYVRPLLENLGMTDRTDGRLYTLHFVEHIGRQVQTVPDLLVESWYLFNQLFPGMFAGR